MTAITVGSQLRGQRSTRPSEARDDDPAHPLAKRVDGIRITFGLIWAVDAALKWRPSFRTGYLAAIKGAGDGQPGWLHPWFTFWSHLEGWHPTAWAYAVAVIETLLAIALLTGVTRKVTYVAGAAFCVLLWAVAEGFGGPYTSSSTDIGAALPYALVFAFLLAVDRSPSRADC